MSPLPDDRSAHEGLARDYLAGVKARVDVALDRLLPTTDQVPGKLHEAMRYSVLSPGKRLRPALALATCRAFGADDERCLDSAAAIEMIHAYSLIHDDLPAMDDDDLRRGKPTNHIEFGEAMAILAGDALNTLACEVLATRPTDPELASERTRVQRLVLDAVGWRGMVGGQVLDLEATGKGGSVSEDEVRAIHERKTGALLRASILVGAEFGGANEEQAKAMRAFADAAGLAFQVVDDILDVTTSSAELGKTGGKDAAAGKVTYPAVLGLEEARKRATELTTTALHELDVALAEATGDAAPLRALTHYILERQV